MAPTEEEEIYLGPAIWRPQEKAGPSIDTHRTLARPAIAALTVRSDIGAHSRRGNILEVSHRRPQEKVGSATGAHRPSSPT